MEGSARRKRGFSFGAQSTGQCRHQGIAIGKHPPFRLCHNAANFNLATLLQFVAPDLVVAVEQAVGIRRAPAAGGVGRDVFALDCPVLEDAYDQIAALH
jgi:hypothetical protein